MLVHSDHTAPEVEKKGRVMKWPPAAAKPQWPTLCVTAAIAGVP